MCWWGLQRTDYTYKVLKGSSKQSWNHHACSCPPVALCFGQNCENTLDELLQCWVLPSGILLRRKVPYPKVVPSLKRTAFQNYRLYIHIEGEKGQRGWLNISMTSWQPPRVLWGRDPEAMLRFKARVWPDCLLISATGMVLGRDGGKHTPHIRPSLLGNKQMET